MVMELETKDEFVVVDVRNIDEIDEKVGKLCNELGKERKKKREKKRKKEKKEKEKEKS